jgi:hypothetical protein
MNPDDLTFHRFNAERALEAAAQDEAPPVPAAESAPDNQAMPADKTICDPQCDGPSPG